MGSREPGNRRPFWYSFVDASRGIFHAVRTERNIKVDLLAASIVVVAALFFQVTKMEWLLLLLTITMVLSLELINTAIERAVDLTTTETKVLARQAKDVAAGACFIAAMASVIIGFVIFFPYVIQFVESS
ncbi:diacylglycerol kinase family protein [Bacillaceae bacterium SIJ1]|uniref:diacylglycerol kinase family protein n=1 Tax=Litoribacterium kuwaitense TaxID=1398745 RepID=UPI0013EA2ECB|nr:diacylglycerol kinase family protein [Litoribacterium kuwaitense]NGP43523.1 diacylglycerol kinase family protein [Litoribacterium kuwaitense]